MQVAAGDGNRLAVAWIADGNVYATSSQGGSRSPARSRRRRQLGGPDAKSIDIDLGVNGAAYVDLAAGRRRRTPRACRTARGRASPRRWTSTRPSRPGPARCGRGSRSAPRATPSSPGATCVPGARACGRAGSPGSRSRAPRRRSTSTAAAAPTRRTSTSRTTARSRGSSSGRTSAASRARSARRLIGSLFEAPEVDRRRRCRRRAARSTWAAAACGYAVAQADGGTMLVGAWLDHDHFQPGGRIDGGDSVEPTQAGGRRRPTAATRRSRGAPAAPTARSRAPASRTADATASAPEFTVSQPELGPVADPGVYDRRRPPGRLRGGDGPGHAGRARADRAPSTTARRARRSSRHRGLQAQDAAGAALAARAWTCGARSASACTWTACVIGRDDERHARPARRRSTTGKHTWQIEAVDRAGQTSRSRVRTLRIDSIAPTLKVEVSGKRAAGKTLKITVRAKDTGGAGLDHITVDYGDKSPTSTTATHPPPLQAREVHAEGGGGRQGGQRRPARKSGCGSRSRDPARGPAPAGARRAGRC